MSVEFGGESRYTLWVKLNYIDWEPIEFTSLEAAVESPKPALFWFVEPSFPVRRGAYIG